MSFQQGSEPAEWIDEEEEWDEPEWSLERPWYVRLWLWLTSRFK